MDPRQRRDLDRLEGEIIDSLSQLNHQLESVLDDSFEVNPAELILDLDLGCDRLAALLRGLDDELDGLAEDAGCELNDLVREIVNDTMAGTSHPLVVTTSWGSSLPRIDVSSRLLGVAVGRLCELASKHAGPGGELSLRTLRQHDGAELILDARPLDPIAGEQACAALVLRCRSIEQFVEGLGGQFSAEREGQGVLRLRLEFAGAEKLS